MKRRIWIVGGTTEGRLLASYALQCGLAAVVSVATPYGASLLPSSPLLTVAAGAMDRGQMEEFVCRQQISFVIDATHPYAKTVTENLRQVCMKHDIAYCRVVRPATPWSRAVTAASMAEAAELLCHEQGNIFLTTGSKDLGVFTAIPSYKERVYVRILPLRQSLDKALDLGYDPAHIICMQGPFSEELNEAMFRQVGAAYVVTKDSGNFGGAAEKASAAERAGASLIVVSRTAEQGLQLDEAKEMIRRLARM